MAYTQPAGKRKVCYYYDADVGNYYYGQGHPMKPHRIRMTHNLLLNYGMYRKLEIYKPFKAGMDEMTKFHSDEYIKFLKTIRPDNGIGGWIFGLIFGRNRACVGFGFCKNRHPNNKLPSPRSTSTKNKCPVSTSEKTRPCSKACTNFRKPQPAGRLPARSS